MGRRPIRVYVDGGPGITAPAWVQSGNLRIGDCIRTESGHDMTVVALRYHSRQAHVYTLTVADDHDFFVGSARVLVHNCDRVYDPKPAQPGGKHGPGGWGTPMDLDPETAQKVLSEGIALDNGKQIYGVYDDRLYEFQPDNAGTYHGYPVPGDQVPNAVLREMKRLGEITQAQYNRAVKGNVIPTASQTDTSSC